MRAQVVHRTGLRGHPRLAPAGRHRGGTDGGRQPVAVPGPAAVHPAHDRPRVRLRPLEPDQVPGVLDHLEACARDLLGEDARVERLHEAIPRPPYHERRGGNARKTLLEAVLRDREEELGRRPEAAHEADQELDLVLRAVVLLAEEIRRGVHQLSGRAVRIVEEIGHELVRHHAEHVDHGGLVAPEADRRREGETADLLRAERGHLGRHPAAHRLADHVRTLEPERLHHVEAVEGEIELVLEVLEPGRLPEAREERRVDAVVPGEEGEHAVPGGDAARAVEEDERGTLARFEDLDRRSPGAELDQPREGGAHTATGRSA